MTLTDHLPTDGRMGALKRQRPTLYWLVVTTGTAAFAGVLLAVFYALALFPLVAGRAVAAAASGDPWLTLLWFAGMAAVAGFFVGVVLAVGRWVGEFGREVGDER